MTPPQRNLQALWGFLIAAFQADELREIALFYLGPGGYVHLPGHEASPASLARTLLELLHARNLIDSAFISELRRLRPRREQELDRIVRDWNTLSESLLPSSRHKTATQVYVGNRQLKIAQQVSVEQNVPAHAACSMIVSQLQLPPSFEKQGFGFHMRYYLTLNNTRIQPDTRVGDLGLREGDYLGIEIEAIPFSGSIQWQPASFAFTGRDGEESTPLTPDEAIAKLLERFQ